MANALLQAWQTGNDAMLAQNQTRMMKFRTDDPYGPLRDQMIPTLMGNYQAALRRQQTGGPRLSSFMAGIPSGNVGPFREVDENPIWNQQQIQGRVNAGRALTDAQRDVNIRDQQRQLSQRGFATHNSPLAMAEEQRQRGLAMMGNAKMENDLRWNAALGNAQHVQGAQMANAGNWETYLGRQNEARGMALQGRLSAYDAYNRARSSYMDQNDPNQFMNALMQMLQVSRPQYSLIGQTDQSMPQWMVDKRTLA